MREGEVMGRWSIAARSRTQVVEPLGLFAALYLESCAGVNPYFIDIVTEDSSSSGVWLVSLKLNRLVN